MSKVAVILMLLAGMSGRPTLAQPPAWDIARVEVERWSIDEGLPQGTVNAIAETPDGALWLGTWGGLVRFDGVAFRVFDVANTPALATNRITELYVDRRGVLWAGTVAGAVTRYAGGQFTHVPIDDGAPLGEVFWITEDDDGVVWVGRQGACRLDGDRFVRDPDMTSEQLLAGRVTVASGPFGASVTAAPGVPLPPRDFLEDDLDSIFGEYQYLYALHVDRHGQLWCGTRRSGIVRVVRSAWRRLEIGHSYRGCRVAPDGAGGLWIGPHRDRGLFHSVGGEIVDRVMGDPDTPMHSVLGLLRARDGTIWARHNRFLTGMQDGDFVVRDLGYVGHNMSPMLETADGAIWCGMDERLCRVTADGVRWLGPEVGYDANTRVSAIGATRDGDVWIGTLGVVYRWDGERFHRLDAADGVPNGFVRVIHEASDSSFWIGTYGGGLARYDGERFEVFTNADGLPDNVVSTIIEDDRGHLWINSNHGAYAVSLAALREHEPGVSPALPIRLIRSGEGDGVGSCLAGDDLIVPTIGVMVAIDMDYALLGHATPPVTLIDHVAVSPSRDLEVAYTAPDLLDPAGTRFEHRLVGYDREWIRAGPRRRAFYTRLPAGDFAFEVVAIDSSGQRSAPASRSVVIPPVFYETTWFAVLVTLAGLGVAYGGYRWRVGEIHARNTALLEEIADRRRAEAALEESRGLLRVLSRKLLTTQDEERRGIARELHDDVTQRLAALSIQAEVLEGRMDGRGEADRQQAADLARTAQRLATDIQQLSRRLHPASLTELGLARAIRSECAAFSKREGMAVEVDIGEIETELPPDITLSAFRILQESLHNVAKHARAGRVGVSLHATNGTLSVGILDNGCGFDPAEIDNGGIGLISMDERARSIGGRLSVESQPGQGTSVLLTVPLGETP